MLSQELIWFYLDQPQAIWWTEAHAKAARRNAQQIRILTLVDHRLTHGQLSEAHAARLEGLRQWLTTEIQVYLGDHYDPQLFSRSQVWPDGSYADPRDSDWYRTALEEASR